MVFSRHHRRRRLRRYRFLLSFVGRPAPARKAPKLGQVCRCEEGYKPLIAEFCMW